MSYLEDRDQLISGFSDLHIDNCAEYFENRRDE